MAQIVTLENLINNYLHEDHNVEHPGAGEPSFAPTFRRMVQQHNLDLCILLETQLSGDSLSRVRHRLSAHWGFDVIESRGLSRGIIVIWRERV